MNKSDIKEKVRWDAFMESRARRTPKARLPCGVDNCNVGARWTRAEYVKLIQLVHPETTMQDMSVAIRRSLSGIQSALIGLRLACPDGPLYHGYSFYASWSWGDVVFVTNKIVKKFDLMEVFIDEEWEPVYDMNGKIKAFRNPLKWQALKTGQFEQSLERRGK